jgi:hypothetical protein
MMAGTRFDLSPTSGPSKKCRPLSSVNRDHRSRARGYGQRSAGLSDVGECAPPLSISMFSASASGGLSLPSVGDASPTPCVFRSPASGRFRAGFFFALGAATTEREEGTRFISPLNCANSASRRALSSLLPMRTQFLCEPQIVCANVREFDLSAVYVHGHTRRCASTARAGRFSCIRSGRASM